MLHKMGKEIYPCHECGDSVVEDEDYAGIVLCMRCIGEQMEARHEPTEAQEWHDYDPDC